MRLLWEDRAWDDYLYWQTQDKKTLKRINALRRIDEANRISYYEKDGIIYVVSCKGHCED